MHFKILLIAVLLITLVDNMEAKKKKGKKKPGNQIPMCKKTDIESLGNKINNLKTETENCCKTRDEDMTLSVNVIEARNNATKARQTIGDVQIDVEKVKTDVEKVKTDVEKVKTDIVEMKSDVKAMKGDLSRMRELIEKMLTSQCESKVPVFPPDCSDNASFTGVRTIQPKGQDSFSVYCSEGCIYMARRFDGSVDFYQGWVKYQEGFGRRDGEHFIGLDNLHGLLRQENYKLIVVLTTWPPQNETRHAEYSIFDVGDERSNYQLTIGGFSGDAGDSLTYHNGMPFTTKDRDLDNKNTNCAVEYKGAWWYNLCHYSNLFAEYNDGPLCPGDGECIAWYHWPNKIGEPHNHFYSFKKVDMKICPI